MRIESRARFPLAQLPTPIEELKSLSRELGGPELLIKRDDQTGLALGGNKTRKLEFLVGQALEQGADTLVTAGAAQSNHCRQTAAAAARAGLRCELLLNGTKPELPNGNLLLDELLGARIHRVQRSEREAKLSQIPDELRKQGGKPYVIPVGGSNGVGATGYVLAMMELAEQLDGMNRRVDHVVFASSSGGTQAGIVVGARVTGFKGKLHGVSIDRDDTRRRHSRASWLISRTRPPNSRLRRAVRGRRFHRRVRLPWRRLRHSERLGARGNSFARFARRNRARSGLHGTRHGSAT